jgi:hypothetical protein
MVVANYSVLMLLTLFAYYLSMSSFWWIALTLTGYSINFWLVMVWFEVTDLTSIVSILILISIPTLTLVGVMVIYASQTL